MSSSGKDQRWRDDETLNPHLRGLLESAKIDEPSAEQLSALQAKIAFLFALPPGGGGGDPGGGGGGAGTGTGGAGAAGVVAKTTISAASATTAGAVKAVLFATVSTLAVVGGAVALSQRPARPAPQEAAVQVTRPQPVATKALPPTLVEPQPEPAKKPAAAARAEAVVSVAKVKPQPPPQASEEVPETELLQQALDALHAGQASDALAAATTHATRFPDSPLAQEREAVAIEALVRLKRGDEARARGERFHARWPTSLHVSKIDELLEQR
jgi:hypothetical protein